MTRAATSSPRIAVFAIVLTFAPPAARATYTWANFAGGNTNWSTAANWNTTPTFNSTTVLVFSGAPPLGPPYQPTGRYTSTTDLSTGFTVNQLVFNNFGAPDFMHGSVVITTNANWAITFAGSNPATTQNGTGVVLVSAPMTLTASGLTINGSGTGDVSLGSVGGSGNLIVNQTGAGPLGSGALVVLQATNTFTDGVTLTNGNSWWRPRTRWVPRPTRWSSTAARSRPSLR
jgi:hypothetical protein